MGKPRKPRYIGSLKSTGTHSLVVQVEGDEDYTLDKDQDHAKSEVGSMPE